VDFLSPSRFALSGPQVRDWRDRESVWVDGAEHSKMFNRCGKCGRALTPKGKHRGDPQRDADHPAYRMWNGRQSPGEWERGNTNRLLLYRGYLNKVLSDLAVSEINGLTPAPEIPVVSLDNLRDYQQEALKTLFSRKWGRIALPTNAGKGAVIALAAHSLALAQVPTLILCDEISVFQALKKEIEKWSGRSPYIVAAGGREPPSPTDMVTLAMVPTLSRREGDLRWHAWFFSVGAVLLDEADKAAAATWQKILRCTPNTHYRIGFSGTFLENEVSVPEMVVFESIGPVLMRLKNIDLIERQISARPFVELVPYPNHVELTGEYWDAEGPEKRMFVYRNGIVRNAARHALIRSLLDPVEPNAVIVNFIEHGEELERVLPNAVFLNGRDKADRRERVLEQFKRGEFQTLIATKILDRGTNSLGKVVGLVLAAGEGSERQNLQRIGRGLRRAGGKEFLFLKDVVDRGHPYFEHASKRRVQLYNSEGFEITIRGQVSGG
jgi:superfamily II DNA or RNA helicase